MSTRAALEALDVDDHIGLNSLPERRRRAAIVQVDHNPLGVVHGDAVAEEGLDGFLVCQKCVRHVDEVHGVPVRRVVTRDIGEDGGHPALAEEVLVPSLQLVEYGVRVGLRAGVRASTV